ncbi:MAG TPA: hypothetical protein VH333_00175 [Pseudonocardiaceae bacterium]|jgi:hypothetical protein|nr:hypothetical protein [Pseudonocardiaceae bacterium]
MSSHDPAEELKLEIMRALEIDWQWVRRYNASDTDDIAAARAAGRRAGRALRTKIRTSQSTPAAGMVEVVVTVSNPAEQPEADQERMAERRRLITGNLDRL